MTLEKSLLKKWPMKKHIDYFEKLADEWLFSSAGKSPVYFGDRKSLGGLLHYVYLDGRRDGKDESGKVALKAEVS